MKPSRGLALLKISVPGFWLIYSTPYVFAYLSAGPMHAGEFLFGLVTVWACVACIAIINDYTDRVEDRANQPARADLAEYVGYGRLLAVALTLIGIGVLILGFVAVEVGTDLAIVCAVGGLVGLLYSVGPRFKRRGVLAQVLIPLGVVVPFLFGWMLNGRTLQSADPVVYLLYYVYFAFSNVKNLPDTRGDRLIGLRTIFTQPGKRLIRLLFLSPYLAIAILVAFQVVDAKYLWSFVTLPGGVLLLLLIARARNMDEKICVYQAGFIYAHLFLICLLVIYHPTWNAALAGAALLLGRVLVTTLKLDRRLLKPDLSVSRTLVRLIAPPKAAPEASTPG